jgi:DNA end-binding protein Ku
LAIAGRERLCAVKPYGSGMMLLTLRYEDEVTRGRSLLSIDIREKASASEEVESGASELIKRKTAAKFDPGKFHDHYREALKELIEAKIENREPVAIEDERPQRQGRQPDGRVAQEPGRKGAAGAQSQR